MSSRDTWQRIDELFAAALALPEDERVDFVNARGGDDPGARDEVLNLLNAQVRMGSFLENSALDFRGEAFGAYRALEEIGRGGMSVVYRGERVDGGFDKRVAIKVVLAQTGAAPETQILASLDHPHIARLLDAGLTPLGFRYLVMEFVEGVPCTKFVTGLSLARRLRLFLQICAGVQYAHQSLVVHRDLKPENILVTADGTVKLLDFGIAKMLAPTGAQTTGARAYTVDYASPEQILGQASSTSNDVYSLGVVLCELVCGRLPRELSGLPLDEIVRQVQGDGPAALPLSGELAVIARKAMSRDPALRYDSAGALARDVERYLGGQPIEARAPTWNYRAGKFIARHRYGVTAVALAAAALGVTAGYAWRQARLAELRFNQVGALSRAVMFELHDAVSPLAGSLPARQMIVDRSLKYLNALAANYSAGDEVLLDAARGYLRLAEIQGKDVQKASVGQSAEALNSVRQAADTARRVRARSPRLAAARAVLLDALESLSSAYENLGQDAEAFATAQEAVTLAEQWLTAEPRNPLAKQKAAAASLRLGDAHAERASWKLAVQAGERAVLLFQQLSAAQPAALDAAAELQGAYNALSAHHFRSGNNAEAARCNQLALTLSRNLHQADPARYRAIYAGDLGMQAALESAGKRFDRSVEIYREQLRLRREMETANPKDFITSIRVVATLDRLSYQLRQAGRIPEAILAAEESLAKLRPLRALDPASAYANSEFVYSLVDLGLAYQEHKRKDDACARFREAANALQGPHSTANLRNSRYGKLAREQAAACPQP